MFAADFMAAIPLSEDITCVKNVHEECAKKCSSMKTAVWCISIFSWLPLERFALFTQIVASVPTENSREQLLSFPEIEKLIAFTVAFSLNRAELLLNSANSGNLRNH